MSKKFWYLTRVSLKKKIGSKWFLITNIILALAVIGIININSIIKFFGGDFSDNLTVYVIDNSNTFNYFETTLDALDEDNLIKIEQTSKTKDELTKDLENSEIIVILNENDSVLKNDPRPAYQHDPERVYALDFGGNNVKFTVAGDVLTVTEIS